MACGLSKHAFVPSTRHYGVGAYAEGIWYQIHGDNDVGIDHNGSARFLRKDICVTCRNSSFFVPMHVVLCPLLMDYLATTLELPSTRLTRRMERRCTDMNEVISGPLRLMDSRYR